MTTGRINQVTTVGPTVWAAARVGHRRTPSSEKRSFKRKNTPKSQSYPQPRPGERYKTFQRNLHRVNSERAAVGNRKTRSKNHRRRVQPHGGDYNHSPRTAHTAPLLAEISSTCWYTGKYHTETYREHPKDWPTGITSGKSTSYAHSQPAEQTGGGTPGHVRQVHADQRIAKVRRNRASLAFLQIYMGTANRQREISVNGG